MGTVMRLGPDPESGSKSGAASSRTAGVPQDGLLTTRNLVIGGVALAVIVGGLWFAFGRGGADQAASGTVPPPTARVAPAAGTAGALPGIAPAAAPIPGPAGSIAPVQPSPGAPPGMPTASSPGLMPPAPGMYGASAPRPGTVQAVPGGPVTPRTTINGEAVGNNMGISTAAGPPVAPGQ
jgi:hypothetical protein